MLVEPTENLEKLIRDEKHRVALEFFQEAWDGAIQEGIEANILVESALTHVLTKLHDSEGESAVSKVVDLLPARLESGHFDADRSLQ